MTTHDGGDVLKWRYCVADRAADGEDTSYDVAIALINAAGAGDVDRLARDVWPHVRSAPAWVGGFQEERYGDGPMPTPAHRLVLERVSWGTWRWRAEHDERATGGGGTFDDALRDATVVAVRRDRMDVLRALAQHIESVLLAPRGSPSAWFAARTRLDDPLMAFPVALARYVAVGAVPLRLHASFAEGTARRAALRGWFEVVWAAAMEARRAASAPWARERFESLRTTVVAGPEPDWPRLIVAASLGGDLVTADALAIAAVGRPVAADRCKAVYDLHLSPMLSSLRSLDDHRRLGGTSAPRQRYTNKETVDERAAEHAGQVCPAPKCVDVAAAIHALVRLSPAALLAPESLREFWSKRLYDWKSYRDYRSYRDVDSLPLAYLPTASLALLRAARELPASNDDGESGPFETLLRVLIGSDRPRSPFSELLGSDAVQQFAFGGEQRHCAKWHEPEPDTSSEEDDDAAARRKRRRQKAAGPTVCAFEQYLHEIEVLCPNDAARTRLHADPVLTDIVARFHPHMLGSRVDTMARDLAAGACRPPPPPPSPPPGSGNWDEHPWTECLSTLLQQWQNAKQCAKCADARAYVWEEPMLEGRVPRLELTSALRAAKCESAAYEREAKQHLYGLRVCLEHWTDAVPPFVWIHVAAHLPTAADAVYARLERAAAAAVPALSWRGGDDTVAQGS